MKFQSRSFVAPAASLVGALLLMVAWPHSAAAVTLPCNGAFAYASQYTSTSALSSACPSNLYYGYTGVDGQISTPSSLPSNLGADDHSAGFLDAQFSTPSTWIKVGWMVGYFSGNGYTIQSPNQYRLYFEETYPSGYYFLQNVSPLALSGHVTYRIEYIGNGCYNTYYNYDTLTDSSCGFPISGAMVAANETGNGGTGSYSSMPLSWFGSATPNTNQTLRLKGGAGWSDWSSAKTTSTTDYRPYFTYSIVSRYIYIKTYGSTQ